MPLPEPVASDALPERADAVVIGAGIAGIVTALELVERGLSVLVCEKGVVAGEQSSRNWGWCRQMGRDPRELPLIRLSLDLWRQMRQRVGAEVGFRECGIAYLCPDGRTLARRQRWHDEHARTHELTSRMIGAEEAQAMTPGSTVDWRGGLFTPDDGRAEPTLAVPAMARAARAKGATIVQNCAVRALEREAGRISGVVTERGTVATDTVVVAAGAWSRLFLGNEGIDFPQLTVVNSVTRTEPLDAPIEHSLAGGGFAIRKRLDGGWTVAHDVLNAAEIVPDSFRLLRDFWPAVKESRHEYALRATPRFLQEARRPRRWRPDEVTPFERERVRDPASVDAVTDSAWDALRRTLPIFEKARIAERWAGAIDVTPDAVPVIDTVDSIPGLHMATGFSGHGFGLGPGAGRLMAQVVTGETPCVDPSPFRLARFERAARSLRAA